jgi:hypothetical protein
VLFRNSSARITQIRLSIFGKPDGGLRKAKPNLDKRKIFHVGGREKNGKKKFFKLSGSLSYPIFPGFISEKHRSE